MSRLRKFCTSHIANPFCGFDIICKNNISCIVFMPKLFTINIESIKDLGKLDFSVGTKGFLFFCGGVLLD